MTFPTLAILIPTIGRPELARMLQSVKEQDLRPGDEVLLVSDYAHNAAARIWAEAILPGRHITLTDGPHRDWGHSPRNKTMPLVKADYLIHADDDDILLPGALTRIRAAVAVHPEDFHMMPFLRHTDHHFVGLEGILAHRLVGTPNLIHPRSVALGIWGTEHGGDFQFISSTISRNPGRTVHWYGDPHYYAYPPADLDLPGCYSAAYRLLRAKNPSYQLLPAKEVWVDLAEQGGLVGREDWQAGWHALAAHLFAGRDLLDIGAGIGFSRPRLSPFVRRLRLQDPGPGLGADLNCPISMIPAETAEVVTAFDVLEHVVADRAFIENLIRIATESVFISTPNWLVSQAANQHHCREYTPSQLIALLDGFEIIGLWAGDCHGFTARQLERAEFAHHTEPHQAVMLRRSMV